MIKSLSKTIAYICPFCYTSNQFQIGIFKFSGGASADLFCAEDTCRHPCGKIIPVHDKLKIITDCPICGEVHTYMLSQNALWNAELMTFTCPNTGVNIFFIGTKANVTRSVDENNRMLSEIADEESDNEFFMMQEMFEKLQDALNKKKISCRCGCKEILVDFASDELILKCEKCGNTKRLSPFEPQVNMFFSQNKIIF